jgi:hypothetical protein
MTVTDIEVGKTYTVTFGESTSPVLITEECEWGGWYGTDLDTNNRVRVATLRRITNEVSNGRQSVTVNNSNTSEEDSNMATATRKTSTTAADRRARRGVKTDDSKTAANGNTTTGTAKPNAKTTKESNTVSTRKISGNAKKTAAKRPAATATTTTTPAKPAAKRKPAAKTTPTVKTVDTLTVTLPMLKTTPNKVQYGGAKGTIITGVYVTKDAVTALSEDSENYLEMTFVPHATEPQHSIRWNEDSDDDKAIGNLYLSRDGIKAAKFGVKASDTLNVEAHIEDENLVLTLTVA